MKLRVLLPGPKRRVEMLERVEKEYLKADVRARATLARMLKHYADGGSLPPEHLKHEGRHSDGAGGELAIYAFRAKQLRLYGIKCEVSGIETFICTEIDPAKKQQLADPGKLSRAATNARMVLDELEGEK